MKYHKSIRISNPCGEIVLKGWSSTVLRDIQRISWRKLKIGRLLNKLEKLK